MLRMLARQFTDVMIIVLLIAAVVAGLIGEAIDAIAILIIVLLNGIVGFVQEYRAERALQSLQELSAPHVSVLRSCQVQQIAEADLVPGDIVLLEAGNKFLLLFFMLFFGGCFRYSGQAPDNSFV